MNAGHSDNATEARAHRRRYRIGIGCAALSALLFSSFTLASRHGLSALHPADIAALRFGIGGLLLLPILLRHGLDGIRMREAAAMAFFGGVGFALIAYAGFRLAPAAHGAVLLHGTLPLFTAAVMWRDARHPRAYGVWLGLCVIGAGVVLMALDSLSSVNARQLAGDGLLLLASLFWSTYGLLVRRTGLAARHAASLVAVLSMVAYVPVYALLHDGNLLHADFREVAVQAGVQGVLVGAVSILVYTQAVAIVGPATAALFTAAVPCMTTLAAIPLLHETPDTKTLFGVGVVTAGMLLAARGGRAGSNSGTTVVGPR